MATFLPYQPKTVREMLDDLGVGRFNQALVTQTMMMSPSSTEASSAPVMVLVSHLQAALNQMGMSLRTTGKLDRPTAEALIAVAGPNALILPWSEVVRAVVAVRDQGGKLAMKKSRAGHLGKATRAGHLGKATRASKTPYKVTVPGLGAFDLPSLPDVPGGMVTYAVGAYLVYRAIKKRKRAS